MLLLQRGGGRLATWIRALVFLRLVSALVSRLRPNEAWVINVAASLFSLAFILHLSWTLLSRHVLPFRIQDYSVLTLSLSCRRVVGDARDAIVACVSQCRGLGGVCIDQMNKVFRALLARIWHAWNHCWWRGNHDGAAADEPELGHSLLAVEMIQPSLPKGSLTAPTLNIMDRLEDVINEQGREERQVSPSKLQDKKKW